MRPLCPAPTTMASNRDPSAGQPRLIAPCSVILSRPLVVWISFRWKIVPSDESRRKTATWVRPIPGIVRLVLTSNLHVRDRRARSGQDRDLAIPPPADDEGEARPVASHGRGGRLPTDRPHTSAIC